MGFDQLPQTAAETPRAERIVYPENPRYRRMRFFSNLLDQSITLPTGYRIGIDPLIGLVPGIGDLIATGLSLYLIYEAARLGLPKRALARMLLNVGIETAVGAFPVLGDIFDAVWKANVRNMRLVDLHYNPAAPERPARRIGWWFLGIFGLFAAGLLILVYLILQGLRALLGV